jgi:hypothetical protein
LQTACLVVCMNVQFKRPTTSNNTLVSKLSGDLFNRAAFTYVKQMGLLVLIKSPKITVIYDS